MEGAIAMSGIGGASSNYYSASASSNKGMSGLVSGMDTENMVKQMLSGTQSKINKQNQLKQQIEWKQVIYRDIITSINSFRGKYFDTTFDSKLKNNLSSSNFFNSMVSSVKSGDSVKIVGTDSSAFSGDMKIKVSQLASSAKLYSNVKMSGNQTITGSAMDIDKIKKALQSGAELSFDLTLDGVTKSIAISSEDISGEIDADTIKGALETKVGQAFGGYIGISMSDNKLSFSINIKDADNNLEKGHELKITGADAGKFGITPGSSTLISGQTKLGTLAGVSGKGYSFTINGEKFEFSANDTVSSMISKINSSKAGVKIAYSSMTDSFTMEASSTGAQYGINITQESGNLMSVLFGSDKIKSAENAASSRLNTSSITAAGLSDGYKTSEASMTFKVNGKDYTFSLPKRKEGDYTKAEVEKNFNEWLKSTFGESNDVANISYSNGKLTTAAGYLVSFDKTKIDTSNSEAMAEAVKTDLALAFGFSTNGASNAVTEKTNISDIPALSGLTFYKEDGTTEATTLEEIKSYESGGNTYNISYSNSKLLIAGNGTIELDGTGLESLFGAKVVMDDGKMYSDVVDAGKDALLEINGIKTSRSSNTFTVDGLTITATKESETETVIGTTRDIDTIVEAIKSFVKDYNEMVDKLHGYVTEDAEYRNYPPLTAEQEDEMSEKEIELWNKKAKTGLIRGDSTVTGFLQSMRTAFYARPENSRIAAYSIGIETSTWNTSGKLVLDETLLRNALASDPEAVEILFTDPKDGLAAKLSGFCDDTAKLSVAKPGALVQIAGADNWSTNAKNNDLYNEMLKIKDRLSNLQNRYDSERARYWKQFNTMESVLASYSAQSSMISQYFTH